MDPAISRSSGSIPPATFALNARNIDNNIEEIDLIPQIRDVGGCDDNLTLKCHVSLIGPTEDEL